MKRSVVTFTTVAFRPVRDFCSIRHQNYYRVTSLFLRFPSKRPAATSVTISLSPNHDSLSRATCTSSATMTSTGAIRPDMKIADSSQSAASKKRKISTQAKFYAVKVGHVPGVYLTWKECEQNITKYKNALCMIKSRIVAQEGLLILWFSRSPDVFNPRGSRCLRSWPRASCCDIIRS